MPGLRRLRLLMLPIRLEAMHYCRESADASRADTLLLRHAT